MSNLLLHQVVLVLEDRGEASPLATSMMLCVVWESMPLPRSRSTRRWGRLSKNKRASACMGEVFALEVHLVLQKACRGQDVEERCF